jgi:hypothetical protein
MLALGDNTSAVGWLHNSSRLDTKLATHSAHLTVARKVAQLVLDADCCLASQHLKGDLNFVADLLSFAGSRAGAGGKRHPIAFDDLPNDILTQRFHLCCPEQIPKTFAMSQLPSKIRRLWQPTGEQQRGPRPNLALMAWILPRGRPRC